MEMILYAALLVLLGIVGLALEVHDRGRRIQALEEEKMALVGRLAVCGSDYQALAAQTKPRLVTPEPRHAPPLQGIASGRPIFTAAKGYRWPIDLDKPAVAAAAAPLKRRKSDQR